MVLKREERKIIYSIYCFMKKEAKKGAVDNIKQCIKRTAEATKFSETTVRRIVKDVRSSGVLTLLRTPCKKRIKNKPITGFDNFHQGVIKRIIHNFHVTENEFPTLEKLRKKLQNDINFQGSLSSLRQIIKDLGFTYKMIENKKYLLIEHSHIRLQRIEYLEKIRKYREEGRSIIFTYESYVDISHASHPSCPDSSIKDLKKPTSRFIIVHAGSETGFIPNALLMFKAISVSGDYHDYINFENYNKWIQTQLIPNLPPNAVVVVGNASYHNKLLDAAPTSNSLKTNMQNWLTQHNISFDETMLKPQLYALIIQNKDQYETFSIDKILSEKGHTVLRLPPYQPDLNPNEMAWSQIKSHVASKNVNWNLTSVSELVKEKIKMMEEGEWQKLSCKVKSMEEEYRKNEHVIDLMTETFIIRDNGSDSESSSEDESDE